MNKDISHFPPQILNVLNNQPYDFATETKFYKSRNSTRTILLVSSILMLIAGSFLSYIIVVISAGGVVSYQSRVNRGRYTDHVITQDNFFQDSSVWIMFLILSLGLVFLIYLMRIKLKKGGYFISTKEYLYSYLNNELKVYTWKNVSSEIKLFNYSGGGDVVLGYTSDKHKAFVNKIGGLADQSDLRRGRMKKTHYAEEIHIAGIPNPTEIARYVKNKVEDLKITNK